MTIFINRSTQFTSALSKERILPFFSAQQQKIVLIAAVVLAFIAATWVAHTFLRTSFFFPKRAQESQSASLPSSPKSLSPVISTLPPGWGTSAPLKASDANKQFYLNTIQSHPSFLPAYWELAIDLKQDETVQLLDGTVMNEKKLYLKVIQLNPSFAEAYHNLGCALADGEDVTLLDGTLMTERELHLKTIQLDPDFAEAYNNLAITLAKGEKIKLPKHKTEMTEQDLYLKAIELKPDFPDVYHNLALTLPKKGSITLLNGEKMTKTQLIKKSTTSGAS